MSRCVPASQAVVVAALCGLENFVSFIRSKVGVFPHHFEWFYKILEETKKFMVAGRNGVQGERQRFAIIFERSARLLQYDEI